MENSSARRAPMPPDIGTGFTMDKFDDWVQARKAVDADVTSYAVKVVSRHLTQSGIQPGEDLLNAKGWDSFGLALRIALEPAFYSKSVSEWVVPLIHELTAICLLNESTPGDPVSRLAGLLVCMFQYNRGFAEDFIKRLPPPHAEAAATRLHDSWYLLDDAISQNASY